MNFVLRALNASVVLMIIAGCAGAGAASGDGRLTSERITVGEREREYLLYTPAATSDGLKLPLVMIFHGGGGTARGIAREVGRSLHSIADSEGFYVVYPEAVDKIWDFGAGVISDSLEQRIDDRAFFGELLDDLLLNLPLDARRVFASGISRGGQASYFIACSFPGRIRAIAPVAMSLPEFMQPMCTDSQDIGVAVMNGTDDPLVPYDGGQIRVGRRERGAVMSTDATIEFWRERNGCSAEIVERDTLNGARDRMDVIRSRWTDCQYSPVVLYRIEGGGHTWPSGRQYLPRVVVGRVNRDIDGAAEAWAFFSQF